jgi:uncharacterized membrane protein YsdA (DUF1294 family)
MGRRIRPVTWFASVALIALVGQIVLLFLVFRLPYTWYHAVVAWLVAANVTTFAFYGYDKGQARNHRSRVPEMVLLGLALSGGTLGAWLGMQLFRHKTIKPTFRLLFIVIAVLQAGLVLAVLYRLWKHGR